MKKIQTLTLVVLLALGPWAVSQAQTADDSVFPRPSATVAPTPSAVPPTESAPAAKPKDGIDDEEAFTKALNIMANHGFEGIANLRRDGDIVSATVLEAGQRKNVSINVVTGQLALP